MTVSADNARSLYKLNNLHDGPGLPRRGCSKDVRVQLVMPPLPTTFDNTTNASVTSVQRRQNDLRELYHAYVAARTLTV